MKPKSKKKKPERGDHVRRFLAILNSIRAGEFPNNTTLAEEIGVARRTVQHHLVLLRDFGAPLEFDREPSASGLDIL